VLSLKVHMAKYFHIRMVYISCVNNLRFSFKCRVFLFSRHLVFLGSFEYLNTALFPFSEPNEAGAFLRDHLSVALRLYNSLLPPFNLLSHLLVLPQHSLLGNRLLASLFLLLWSLLRWIFSLLAHFGSHAALALWHWSF
jgi:hypothetical protein